ncbi:MAG: sigma 54-interacting transcriptional regulator [Firmicutes bacterium]|nr:sigma 54-interacting transcriptional regulator [Bacillota bacterium]
MSGILVIAPYDGLASLAQEVCRELGEDAEICIARMEKGVELAKKAAKNGYLVIVSRGVTSWLIQRAGVSLPVVDVPIWGEDLLRAYYQAKQFGDRVGIVDIPEVIRVARSLEANLGENFIKYTLDEQGHNIGQGIMALKSAGAGVVIGKIAMTQEAQNLGMNGVIITSGKEAVVQAIREAKSVLTTRLPAKRPVYSVPVPVAGRVMAGKGHIAKYTFDDILGEDPRLVEVLYQAREYATVNSTVLISGETGTGKEMFAHAIHLAGARKAGPFVAVNCAALPENLLESELFGYVEGAFTGARKSGKPGLFELANQGTIFLDEIGEMSSRLQARVLRVLEEGEILRLGDERVIRIDVRVIAATNRDLVLMVQDVAFRKDLYYRINVLPLEIPPLRERGGDAVFLAEYFLSILCKQLGKEPPRLSPEAQRAISSHPWPGNIRELRNVAERLALRCQGPEVSGAELVRIAGLAALNGPALKPDGRLFDTMERLEREVILEAVAETNGNRSEAARRLGISRTTLWRRLN